jgi:protein-disulfide isomerase
MKNAFVPALVSSLVLALAACGHTPEESPAEAIAEAPQAAKAAPAKAAPAAEKPHGEGECGCNGEPEPAPESAAIEKVGLGAAPLRGREGAPVTIVVFADFECPFCAKAEGTLRAIEQRYPGQVRIALRNHPLPFHANAKLAARAALAAGEQGKYWEYEEALFAHLGAQDQLALERIALSLRLDLTRFRAALDAERTAAAVEADEAEAQRLGVAGTPTFFINGRRLIGAQPVERFVALIDLALAGR